MTIINNSRSSGLLKRVASELDGMKQDVPLHDFPLSCRGMMYSLPGNLQCVDCCAPNPTWASITHGALLCLQCSGRHRSYGVSVSKVRSVDMDAWSHDQILCMLEGGNEQLNGFFERHKMGNNIHEMADKRYKTKAALFYRTHLQQHVEVVAGSGLYAGRDAIRSKNCNETPTSISERDQPPTICPTKSCVIKANNSTKDCHPTMEAVRPKRISNLPTATTHTRHMQ